MNLDTPGVVLWACAMRHASLNIAKPAPKLTKRGKVRKVNRRTVVAAPPTAAESLAQWTGQCPAACEEAIQRAVMAGLVEPGDDPQHLTLAGTHARTDTSDHVFEWIISRL